MKASLSLLHSQQPTVGGIASVYGLDGPGIETWWGRYFPYLSKQALEPTEPPIQRVTDFLPGGKAAGAWI